MKNKKKLFGVVILTSIFIYFFAYILVLKTFFYDINGEFLYFLKNILSIKASINSNLVVVEIDDLTYNELGFPINRSDYIPFLENLKEAKPSVLGLDILFLDKGKIQENDILLSEKFKDLGNVVIGSDIKEENKIILPYEDFRDFTDGIGYFTPIENKNTNKVYSIKPFSNFLDEKGGVSNFEAFAFSILRTYYNYIYSKDYKEISGEFSGKIYRFFNKNIPLKNGDFYINFSDPKYFYKESFYNIYTGNFDKDFFKDKIVLVGYSAKGVKDDFLIPNFGNIKGIYIHANAINNILNDNYIIYFDILIEHLISFLFIFFIVYLNIFHFKHLNLKLLTLGVIFLFLIISGTYFIFFYISYKNSGVYLLPNNPFEFISILFLSFFASAILKYINEDKNKKLLSKALGEYVSNDIVREILNSTGKINLSGENKKITIFFSDIEGFTTISEKLTPEKLVEFLKVYLGNMSSIIMDNKGFINKYEGDAIMALWGVFLKTTNFGIIEACSTALLQQRKLNLLNQDWQTQEIQKINVRMGIHCGNAIIGNIGAVGRKMEFTALGDSVNLASRLEGVNKFYKTNICVSEDVYLKAKEHFTFRYLDKIKVKGKNIGINIYELISFLGEAGIYKEKIIKDFEGAIKLYMKREFQSAKIIFEKLVRLGDNPSETYVKRCENYIKNPPSNDWNGIWSMDEK